MKKYILLFIFTGLLYGCTDFLERNHPTGITDDKFWKTSAQAEAALASCKHFPNGTHYYTSPYMSLVHMEGMTDNMYHAGDFKGEIVSIGNGSVSPTSGGLISEVWENWYILIRRCCRLLDNIHKPYFTDEKERARIAAEARIWRAWYHMQLLMYYGGTEGIPIVDNTLAPDEIYLPRTSLENCLKYINDEFDKVLNSDDLPFTWDENRRTRMSKSVVYALKMELNLQYKQYDIAKACAAEIIKSGQFELYYSTAADDDPGKNYRDLFRYIGESNKERILFCESGLKEFWFRSMGTGLGGQGATCPLRALVDTYETLDGKTLESLPASEKEAFQKDPLYKARDPRLFSTIMLPGDNSSLLNYTYSPWDPSSSDAIGKPGASRSGFMLKKYLDEADRSQTYSGSLDFMIIRYAEVLLTYVECLVETGQWNHPHVIQYLNEIRQRAGMPDVNLSIYNSEEKIRELYQRERRIELAFEGKRYFDIRRWGIAEKVMKGNAYGAYNPTTEQFLVVEERQYSSPKNDTWPLPQSEITSNPNIHQPQGW